MEDEIRDEAAFTHWYNHYRAVFPAITVEQIKAFEVRRRRGDKGCRGAGWR